METDFYAPPKAPLADAFLDAALDRGALLGLLGWLGRSLAMEMLALFVMLSTLHDPTLAELTVVMRLLFFVSGIAFYVILGTLAYRLGRSVILWCGIAIALGPLGVL